MTVILIGMGTKMGTALVIFDWTVASLMVENGKQLQAGC